jgi:hypothetical protein
MHFNWIAAAALAAAFLGAPDARAQLADISTPTPVAQHEASSQTAISPAFADRGPTMGAAAISPRLDVAGQREAAALAAQGRPFGRSQTLMIIGGATFLAGAIIGDDAGTVMMVAGAGVGLYGLYLYLQQPSATSARSMGVGYSLAVNP